MGSEIIKKNDSIEIVRVAAIFVGQKKPAVSLTLFTSVTNKEHKKLLLVYPCFPQRTHCFTVLMTVQ